MKQSVLLVADFFSLFSLLGVPIHLETVVHFWKSRKHYDIGIFPLGVSSTFSSCGVHTGEFEHPELFFNVTVR